jgi:hypothetical protein
LISNNRQSFVLRIALEIIASMSDTLTMQEMNQILCVVVSDGKTPVSYWPEGPSLRNGSTATGPLAAAVDASLEFNIEVLTDGSVLVTPRLRSDGFDTFEGWDVEKLERLQLAASKVNLDGWCALGRRDIYVCPGDTVILPAEITVAHIEDASHRLERIFELGSKYSDDREQLILQAGRIACDLLGVFLKLIPVAMKGKFLKDIRRVGR